jgi:hypothetical protein
MQLMSANNAAASSSYLNSNNSNNNNNSVASFNNIQDGYGGANADVSNASFSMNSISMGGGGMGSLRIKGGMASIAKNLNLSLPNNVQMWMNGGNNMPAKVS